MPSVPVAQLQDYVGKELGRGTLHSIILEYEKGIVVVYGAGAGGSADGRAFRCRAEAQIILG